MFSDGWLRNDKNIEKCSMISICSVMGGFTLFFSILTHKTETGAANRWGTTDSKPPGPIIMTGR
jgi:hypothetical protein